MKKLVKVCFSKDWEKTSQSMTDNCIEALSRLSASEISIVAKDTASCEVVVGIGRDSAEMMGNGFEGYLIAELGITEEEAELYMKVSSQALEDISFVPYTDPDAKKNEKQEPEEIPADLIENLIVKPTPIPKTEEPEPDSEELKKIKALTGSVEFKAFASETVSTCRQMKAHKTENILSERAYLFAIDPGCGLTTYLSHCIELFRELGITSKKSVKEISVPAEEKELKQFIENETYIPSSAVSSVCFDLSDVMQQMNTPLFRKLLCAIRGTESIRPVFFRVPFLDYEVLLKIKAQLSDIFSVRTICVPQLNSSELRIIAEDKLNAYGYKIDDGAWETIVDRIAEEKTDGRFYGIKTLEKVLNEVIVLKQLACVGKEDTDLITAAEISGLTGTMPAEIPAEKMFERLVGIDSIRKRIYDIVEQIEYIKKHETGKYPCIHMQFVGNPGTGKTTVARIVGRLFRERGILQNGYFFEYTGRDLVGQYIGSTAPKTASICRDAYGSVLFIDEAYALYTKEGSEKDYGKEALATLISEMENHRSDFVVIFAGYRKEMEELMEGNPGLRSRIPYVVEFNNYSRDELFEIFKKMKGADTEFADGLLDAVKQYFDTLPEEFITSTDFSNARYVRNLYERTCNKCIARSHLSGEQTLVIRPEDFALATSDSEFDKFIPKKRNLGFV